MLMSLANKYCTVLYLVFCTLLILPLLIFVNTWALSTLESNYLHVHVCIINNIVHVYTVYNVYVSCMLFS